MAGAAHVRYEPVIGLEVHAQLATRSKIFCGCPTVFGAEPNTQVCPVCLGLPGALPVLNGEAVSMALRVGLALHCGISAESVFARKNYFYPDSPKNYQISMYDRPLCTGGFLEIELDGASRRIGVERIHLEEDAGKLVHDPARGSLVDFNRCGVPLVEIVTRPDIGSAEEASGFLIRLRQLLRYLGVCDGNMEEGSLRCDVNVSLREAGSARLGTKTEIKNLNSFKAVEAGIRTEIGRQEAALGAGKRIEQATSLWDAGAKRLVVMRTKEYAHDYRYFPEPDLPPLVVGEEWIQRERGAMPEAPLERKRRFEREYSLSGYAADLLTSERGIADYFELVAAGAGDPRAASNWVMRDVLAALNRLGFPIDRYPVDPGRLAALLRLVAAGGVSATAGRAVLEEMERTDEEPEAVIARLGLGQVSDLSRIEAVVDEVLEANPVEVGRYRAGKKKLLGWFVGEVIKRSGGAANPKLTSDIVRRRLEE